MSCDFCGMPPLDGEPCCTLTFKRDVMKRAGSQIAALRERVAGLEKGLRDARKQFAACQRELLRSLDDEGAFCGSEKAEARAEMRKDLAAIDAVLEPK